MDGLITGYEICRQFCRQIDQLYIRQPALPPITFVAEVNLSSQLSELEIPTWQILPWNEVHSTADILAVRTRQLQRRDDDLEEATLHL